MLVTLRYPGNPCVSKYMAINKRRWGELRIFQTVAWEKVVYISVAS